MKKFLFIFLLFYSSCFSQKSIEYITVYPKEEVHSIEEGKYDNISLFKFNISGAERFKYKYCRISAYVMDSKKEAISHNNLVSAFTGFDNEYKEDQTTAENGYITLKITTANLPTLLISVSYNGENLGMTLNNVKIDFLNDFNLSYDPSLGNILYFVEEYTKDGEEIGRSDKFYIKSSGGYITAMLRTEYPIGVSSVDLRLERETLNDNEFIDNEPYDVTPTKSYFFFDKITFYKPGDYIINVFKKDGSLIASGKVRIGIK